jgi:hypothetical protein
MSKEIKALRTLSVPWIVFAWKQRCAYALWQLNGAPVCDGKKYWYQAEELLRRDSGHILVRPQSVAKSHYRESFHHEDRE